ncbi:antibiotic biosynthesis monooxygenase [Brachybacterium endophyticum]|uniref:Antibiotic biosynthesis monooxygenase n=1 Tax=Brachybacterium endophyticum TaxID=2182385 RepID=A0A2U2RN00_9MICO|nr:antibiotic biosynthesis monooxygenase [Brachybacterium endophyticum]PWH07154.1 antibiotic biosynthesis monooxygenase [Brachybacterium endophyticum]
MTVIVTAVFFPKSGKKQELVDAMQRGIAAVHEEKGCELYAIHDAEDGTITMIEKWTTADDLATHGSGEAVGQLNSDIAELIEKPTQVTTMTPLPSGAEKQGAI